MDINLGSVIQALAKGEPLSALSSVLRPQAAAVERISQKGAGIAGLIAVTAVGGLAYFSRDRAQATRLTLTSVAAASLVLAGLGWVVNRAAAAGVGS